MKVPVIHVLPFFSLVLACLVSPGAAAEKNVIFIITDDESPTLGCYGDPLAKTPAVDALAADGTVFLNAYATTASCAASRSVVMSGLHNHRNGMYGHQHSYHKFESWKTVVSLSLPRVMAGAGYRTGQIGKYHVGPELVYRYETYLKANERSTVEMAEKCRDFINADDERPFFLYFATADPHRGGGLDETSQLELKPNLFGNKPGHGAFPGVEEVFYDPAKVPIPYFLTDNPEAREELAQYYQSISRVDQGVARLVEILKEAGLYDKTMILFTADHGMAFPGGKTTVYEGGLRVPFVVRNPYEPKRGVRHEALVSHIDITPSLLDFAGGLDQEKNRPKAFVNAKDFWKDHPDVAKDNLGPVLDHYHGNSWISILGDGKAEHWDTLHASHTFHEIQMYYPMRVVRDKHYKLIWNIAHGLPYPFASDLWAASSFQAQYRKSLDAPYGQKTVGEYIHRPAFELYRIDEDPYEAKNLAGDPAYTEILRQYQEKLRAFQKEMDDPWILKWDYE
ncbi:MAG: sulfatase [Verrucomicrobiae bacterium]|nr:sulfatase [Verrucomicrobiae bacterium]